MLNQICIVLVEPSHPGNIGASARAMKTMGLENLYLVSPHLFPHAKALELASGATDILDNAVLFPSLKEAIADCSLVIGASARIRSIPWPLITPREMAEKVKQEPVGSKIAILFGREQSGLNNEELQCCHLHVQIPTSPLYSSLNLSAAVQVIAYELHLASLYSNVIPQNWDYPPASEDAMEKFFMHLQKVLIDIDFLKQNAPRRLMTRLRRLFLRARPDTMEINMLRGMLAAIEEKKPKGAAQSKASTSKLYSPSND